jgi:hypothetical protein
MFAALPDTPESRLPVNVPGAMMVLEDMFAHKLMAMHEPISQNR